MYRILDLFCGGGGAAEGYHQAGFEVVGVDLYPQKRYPFEFHQADALQYLAEHGKEFDAIHASPVCKKFTSLQAVWKRDHPDFITPLRPMLHKLEKPFVIENVEGAPLENPFMLCGTMFAMKTFRHRIFETNFFVLTPPHISHKRSGLFAARTSRTPTRPGQVFSVYGHFSGVKAAGRALNLEWMSRDEMSQAIPPAYTKYIGAYLWQHLDYLGALASSPGSRSCHQSSISNLQSRPYDLPR